MPANDHAVILVTRLGVVNRRRGNLACLKLM